MPIEADILYRNRDQIAADFKQRLQARIPDVWIEEDGNVSILSQVLGEILEGVYLANQILRDNIFIQSANITELRRHGEEYGLSIKTGTYATGTVRFSGEGGRLIEAGALVGFDAGAGDILYYTTTEDATIPSPGVPGIPTIADSGVAGNPTAGTYEYLITFVTAEGETLAGGESLPLVLGVAHKIDVTFIVGGTGTTARRIYRQKNGGGYKLVTTIANNVATTYQDNIADGGLGGAPPTESTAERVLADIQSEDTGSQYNTAIGTITLLADVPDGVNDVTNTTVVTNGSDEENIETYRSRLLDFIRNPKSGSQGDLEAWALEIEGVAVATAFSNESTDPNLMTANEASAETDASAWANLANTTVASTAAQAAHGTKSVQMTAASAADMSIAMAVAEACVPGERMTALASFRSAVTARQVKVGLQWLTAADVVISTVYGNTEPDSAAAWTQAIVSATAPATAAKVKVVAFVTAPANAEVHYMDKALLAKGVITTWTNGGTILSPAPGHSTIRIAGPNGTVPDAGKVAEVLAHLEDQDVANISLHVTTFTPVPVAVGITVTLAGSYVLADVSPSVVAAITSYINSIPVGGTVYKSGIVDAAFGLAGVLTVNVTAPAGDTTTSSTEKAVAGVITVA